MAVIVLMAEKCNSVYLGSCEATEGASHLSPYLQISQDIIK